MNFHIQMPTTGSKDTAKKNKLEMLFLCPYVSEKKSLTAIQPKSIGVNDLWSGGRGGDAWKICGWKKMFQTAFLLVSTVGLLCKLCVRQIYDRLSGNYLFSNVQLTTPLNPTYSSLAQN